MYTIEALLEKKSEVLKKAKKLQEAVSEIKQVIDDLLSPLDMVSQEAYAKSTNKFLYRLEGTCQVDAIARTLHELLRDSSNLEVSKPISIEKAIEWRDKLLESATFYMGIYKGETNVESGRSAKYLDALIHCCDEMSKKMSSLSMSIAMSGSKP